MAGACPRPASGGGINRCADLGRIKSGSDSLRALFIVVFCLPERGFAAAAWTLPFFPSFSLITISPRRPAADRVESGRSGRKWTSRGVGGWVGGIRWVRTRHASNQRKRMGWCTTCIWMNGMRHSKSKQPCTIFFLQIMVIRRGACVQIIIICFGNWCAFQRSV